ncbi:hypothetical protein [Actinomadura opuntiae]|uniref:hypothetical protein n=1 Tax=Actinomadura sp. OS1-43 TaxID=604315 RepID=UPI00255A93CB|nr:hypothetical protein [Actinomadura sp. OS1-43]MDL4812801.1 hypothetical protein [Actinomadura sp. OS1-43]
MQARIMTDHQQPTRVSGLTPDGLADFARRLPAPPPVRALEVGPGVAEQLAAAAPATPAPLLPLSPAELLTGIPASDLAPGAWRLVGQDGHTLREGHLTGGEEPVFRWLDT